MENIYMWVAVTFSERGSNDGGELHGVFSSKYLAMRVFAGEDWMPKGRPDPIETTIVDYYVGKEIVAQVFRVTVDEQTSIEV